MPVVLLPWSLASRQRQSATRLVREMGGRGLRLGLSRLDSNFISKLYFHRIVCPRRNTTQIWLPWQTAGTTSGWYFLRVASQLTNRQTSSKILYGWSMRKRTTDRNKNMNMTQIQWRNLLWKGPLAGRFILNIELYSYFDVGVTWRDVVDDVKIKYNYKYNSFSVLTDRPLFQMMVYIKGTYCSVAVESQMRLTSC